MDTNDLFRIVNGAADSFKKERSIRSTDLRVYVTASGKVNVRDSYYTIATISLVSENQVILTDRGLIFMGDTPYAPIFRRICQEIENSGLNIEYVIPGGVKMDPSDYSKLDLQ